MYSDKYDLIFELSTEDGIFSAYKNHSIKVKFNDRTILYLHNKRKTCKIISKFGHHCNVLLDNPKEFAWYLL